MVKARSVVSFMDSNSRDRSSGHIGHSTDVGSPPGDKHEEVI